MRENTVMTKWKAGEPTFGTWLSIPSSFSAEVMAHQGFDYVCVDMQHGVIDYQVALTMLQAISTTPSIPFARVPSNDFGMIGKLLDAGVYGVVIPMVNSPAEAKAAVDACKYFPLGARSFGPVRAGYYGGPDYFANANDHVACIPMIETRQAVEQIDDILAVDGIDAVYIGPADLSITLGLRPGMDNDGEFIPALERVVESCKRHGVTPGIHSNAQLAQKRVSGGFQMITVSGDTGAMAAGAARDLKTVREQASQGQPAYT
jgi:4-hydroxy-2-oxoheptanedioate aldolase